MTLTSQTLAAVPEEWTDLDDAEKNMPPQKPELRSKMLEQMEIDGTIEVRLHGSPPMVQVRRKFK